MNALTVINTPTPIVFVENCEVFACSRDVAEYFGRTHKNVLQAINNLSMSDEFRELNFQPSFYTIETSAKTYKCVNLTKDGFTRIAFSFIGKKAGMFIKAYIKRFNDMEAELRTTQPDQWSADVPTTLADALRMAADNLEKTEKFQLQLEFKDKVIENVGRSLIAAGQELDVAHETIGKHHHQLMKFARMLVGVNSMKVQETLRDLGY